MLAVAAAAALLYAQRCASCHGAIGQGSPVAPPLIGVPAVEVHFMLDSGRMPAVTPNVNEIRRPPAFSPQQIDALTAYVERLSVRPDLAMPVVAPGDAVRGRALFDENCQQCHGAVANGASIGSDDVAPSLMGVPPLDVAEAVRAGPGIMPRFSRNALSDRDVDDIASYVAYVQAHQRASDEDAGGFGLAHLGPVAEGLIAWIFGIGALLVFLRNVGTSE